MADLRAFLRAVFGVERVAAWLVAGAALALVLTVATATGGSLLLGPPAATFDGTYDASENAVTITHAGGDRITAGEVTLAITNATGDQTTTVVWTRASDDPLGEGNSVTVDDPTVDSDGDGNYFDGDRTVEFPVTEGATVTINWTGRPFGAPEATTVTLDTDEVTE
ncbi:type IV pilin [Halobacteriales archaeon QS_4_62_28]|nr:MAG: type IV pilin [Halobacteriales archaeon QS_4_62_28]